MRALYNMALAALGRLGVHQINIATQHKLAAPSPLNPQNSPL